MAFMRCMTDHRIKSNPLSSFENKQRSFSNISYMVFFTYFTIYGALQNLQQYGCQTGNKFKEKSRVEL
jgi:hypothetical protein